jgi:hypothetical protein
MNTRMSTTQIWGMPIVILPSPLCPGVVVYGPS